MSDAGSSPNNVLDASLAFFRCDSAQDLYQAVAAADRRRIEGWRDEYRGFASLTRSRAPNLIENELRPYFHEPQRVTQWATAGFWSDDTWTTVDAIKHRLLYCHSLAVDDHLGDELIDCLGRMTHTSGIAAKEPLLNDVNLLIHLAPLLRSQILCPIARPWYLKDTPDPACCVTTSFRPMAATCPRWRSVSSTTSTPALPTYVFRCAIAR
jgi:hypothetical protein